MSRHHRPKKKSRRDEHIDLPAERAVIGSLLLDPTVGRSIIAMLEAGDFSDPRCRVVYDAIAAVYAEVGSCDTVLLRRQLSSTDRLHLAGGEVAIHRFIEDTPSTANALHYAKIVKNDSANRFLKWSAGVASNGVGIDRTVELLQRGLATYTERQEAASGGSPIHWYHETREKDLPPRQFLIHPWIPHRKISLLAGESGVGKTWLAVQIARQLAIGSGGVCDQPVVCKPQRVLLVMGEDDEQELADRGEFIHAGYDDPKTLAFIEAPDAGNPAATQLGTAAGMMWLRAQVESHNFEVVVLDNLFSLSGIELVEMREASEMMTGFRKLAKDFGVTVVLVHHPRKDKGMGRKGGAGLDDLFGSGAIRAMVDSILYLSPQKGTKVRILRHAKGRSAQEAETLLVELEPGQGFVKRGVMKIEEERSEKKKVSAMSILEALRKAAPLSLSMSGLADEAQCSQATVRRVTRQAKGQWADWVKDRTIEVTQTTQRGAPTGWRYLALEERVDPPPEQQEVTFDDFSF